MSDRKLPENLENPIDNFIINNGKFLYPLYKKLHFTPISLTTISLIFSLISTYFFYKGQYVLSSLLYFISYSYDAFDGNYAREYQMVTSFGDLYDHIKDLVCGIIFAIVFYKYNRLSFSLITLSSILLAIFLILGCVNLGYQEIYVSKNDAKNSSNYLSILKVLGNNEFVKKNIKILKYFGIGSFNVLVSFIILLNLL